MFAKKKIDMADEIKQMLHAVQEGVPNHNATIQSHIEYGEGTAWTYKRLDPIRKHLRTHPDFNDVKIEFNGMSTPHGSIDWLGFSINKAELTARIQAAGLLPTQTHDDSERSPTSPTSPGKRSPQAKR